MADQPETAAWPAIDTSEPNRPPRPSRVCAATTRSGRPCESAPHGDSAYCWMHDPEVSAEDRRAARVAGGQNRKRRGFGPPSQVRLPSAETLTAVIAESISKVRSGMLQPHVGEALCRMAATGVRCLSTVDLEKRVAALEAEAQDAKKGAK